MLRGMMLTEWMMCAKRSMLSKKMLNADILVECYVLRGWDSVLGRLLASRC